MHDEKMTLFKNVLHYDIPHVVVTRKGEDYYVGFVIDEDDMTLRYIMYNIRSTEDLDAFLKGDIGAKHLYQAACDFLIVTYSFVDGEYSVEEIEKDQINTERLPSPDFYCCIADVSET